MNRFSSLAVTAVALTAILSSACAPVQPAASTSGGQAATQPPAISKPLTTTTVAAVASSAPVTVSTATTPATSIRLGDQIIVEGVGAEVAGSTVTITAGGSYRLSGSLPDGQVIVAARNSETVQLILNGADIASSSSAPVFVKSAKSATLVLEDGSVNVLADGATRPATAAGEDEPNVALYSAVDLAVSGGGSLVVNARYNDGIASKDDLRVTSGTIAVTSVADGIRGRDSLSIDGGTITVNAGKDGLKSSNDEDPEKGVVAITGGSIQVTAQGDGIQAETDVAISGGTIAILAGGGSAAGSPVADVSAKGIKGTVDVTIDGGNITVDAADDAVHSNGSLTIRGGTLLLATADDGMHADATLDIAGGEITIATSNEGIESARIAISDGQIRLSSRDDGLNAAGGEGESAAPGRPGQPSAASNYHLAISGGYVMIDAAGDGLDANGTIDMTGGTVIVHGPSAQNNAAIDYDRAFNISGGTLIAAGSAGMAQAPSTTSTQPSVLVGLPASQAAGTIVHLGTASGAELVTFAPNKAYQSLVVSSPALEQGAAYLVHTGGSSTGAATDGLYAGGAYTSGSQVASFTVAGAVTNAGVATAGPGRPGGPRR